MLDVYGRTAVGYAEAALIRMMRDCDLYDDGYNINHRTGDKGGSGPRRIEHEFDTYFVYLAVKAEVAL